MRRIRSTVTASTARRWFQRDISALEGVYRNNGFAEVKVTPETSTPVRRRNSADVAQQPKAHRPTLLS